MLPVFFFVWHRLSVCNLYLSPLKFMVLKTYFLRHAIDQKAISIWHGLHPMCTVVKSAALAELQSLAGGSKGVCWGHIDEDAPPPPPPAAGWGCYFLHPAFLLQAGRLQLQASIALGWHQPVNQTSFRTKLRSPFNFLIWLQKCNPPYWTRDFNEQK